MKPGDIVLIRFPQADLNQGKLRPALINARLEKYIIRTTETYQRYFNQLAKTIK